MQENNNDIMYIKGVGPKRAEVLLKSGIHTIYDLITYFPTAYINRESASSVSTIRLQLLNHFNPKLSFEDINRPQFYSIQKEFSIIATIHKVNVRMIKNNKKILTLIMKDANDERFEIIFFSGTEYFFSIYSEGKILVINGIPSINNFNNLLTFSHPDVEVIDEEDIINYSKGGIIPKYKITDEMRKAGISIRVMRTIISNALEIWKNENKQITETLPDYIIDKLQLCPINKVIDTLHFPTNFNEIDNAKYRIKFEEIFWYQLVLNKNRINIRNTEQGIKITEKSKLARQLYDTLPFKLTTDQKKVLNDIAKDFASGKPMNRLLQGDVGSGKTIVAVLAMMMVIDAGYQVAMMCPTELLAEQHYLTIINLINNSTTELEEAKRMLNWLNDAEPPTQKNALDLHIDLLLGGTRSKERKHILERLRTGVTNIIIGTHSLFQSSVVYNNLGLVIIDEQHRFGVEQRSELLNMAKQSITK
jgi:ATP-dependent DNA helicase RecG